MGAYWKEQLCLGSTKKQKNPIFQISVDILQNINFFRAFTASASVPAIYIQQFWNTLAYEAKTRAYSFQLDETRFVLDANLLREALEITPIDQAHQFVSPLSGDAIMDYLGIQRKFTLCQEWRPTKKGRKDKPHVIPYCQFTKLIICHLGRKHNLHQISESLLHLAEEDLCLGNLKFVPKGEKDKVFGIPIPNVLIMDSIRNAPYYEVYLGMVAKHDRNIAAEKEGKKKSISKADPSKKPATVKQLKPKPVKEKSSKPAPAPKPKRRTPATEEASTGPSAQPHDDASTNMVSDSPSPADAETGADTYKTNIGGDTEILQIGKEQGEDVDNQVNLEEKTVELDQGQAGSDPGKTPESRPPPEQVFMDEDQAGPDPGESRVALAVPNPKPTHDEFIANVYPNVHESLKFLADEHVILDDPLSSSGTLSSMKNLDDAYTIRDQFLNDKSTEYEARKLNVEAEVVSMVIVSIYQASSSVPLLSTPVIDLSPPKPVPFTT
ncbi:hypothetical protein Tco_0618001 [Tanacetum coccineum]